MYLFLFVPLKQWNPSVTEIVFLNCFSSFLALFVRQNHATSFQLATVIKITNINGKSHISISYICGDWRVLQLMGIVFLKYLLLLFQFQSNFNLILYLHTGQNISVEWYYLNISWASLALYLKASILRDVKLYSNKTTKTTSSKKGWNKILALLGVMLSGWLWLPPTSWVFEDISIVFLLPQQLFT